MSVIKVQHCEYSQNPKTNNVFDLIGDKTRTDIQFIRVEKPQKDFMKNQGAKYVIQSFRKGMKTLFTGLIPLGDNYYYGDILHPNGKKDFLIIYYNRIRRRDITLFLYKNRNPRNKADFANSQLEGIGQQIKLPHIF